MSLRIKIKENFLSFFITIIFIIWILYLLIMGFLSTREVYFYDVLHQEDLSEQYTSEVPFLRYLIEPLLGIITIFTFNNDPSNTLPFFFLSIISFRVFLFIIDRKVLKNSIKKTIITDFVKDILKFYIKYGSLLFLIFAVILLTGYSLFGFLFLANYFSLIFHIGGIIGVSAVFSKIIFGLFKLSHPYLTIKIKKKRSKNLAFSLLKKARNELGLIWVAFILFFSFNFALLSIRFPTQEIKVNLDENEFLFDFHVHTTFSDGAFTPEQRVMWYIDQGFHGAAISDHHNPRGAIAAREFVKRNNLDFVVLIGQEFTSDGEGLHLNVFGIEEDLTPKNYYGTDTQPGAYTPNLMNTSEMISYVKARGGYVIVNHYSDDPPGYPYTYDQLKDWGVDGFEIHGGRTDIREYCLNNNLTCFSNSDDHGTKAIDRFVKFRLDDPTNLTLDNIFRILRKNEHQCIEIHTPNYWEDFNVPIKDYVNEFREFKKMHNYFMNLDTYQSLSWIVWSFIIYLIIMLFIRKIKHLDLHKLQQKFVYIS